MAFGGRFAEGRFESGRFNAGKFGFSIAGVSGVSVSLSGLASSPVHGSFAQIGTQLTGTVNNAAPGAVIVHRWRSNLGLIAGADAATFTPAIGANLQDLAYLWYAPLVDGQEVAGASFRVRHAALSASGALVDQSYGQNTGVRTVNASVDISGGGGRSYSVSGGPAGTVIDATTGLLSIPTTSLFSSAPVVVTVSNSGGADVTTSFAVEVIEQAQSGTQSFGALTRAGHGGIAAPAGATAITGGSAAAGYSLSAGLVVPASDGSAIAGTLEFAGTSETMTLGEPALNHLSVRCDQVEIRAAALAAQALSTNTYTLSVRDGVASGARLNLGGIIMAGALLVLGAGQAASLPGATLDNSESVTLRDLALVRLWDAGDSKDCIVSMDDTVDCHVDQCLTESDAMIGQDYAGVGHRGLVHISAAGGTSMTSCTITNNTMRWGSRAFYCTDCDAVNFWSNDIEDMYGNFLEIHGQFSVRYNIANGIWAHGGGAGLTGPNNPTGQAGLYPYDVDDPHSSVMGTGGETTGQDVVANILNVDPTRRLTLNGDYIGLGSGFKLNDPTGFQDLSTVTAPTFDSVIIMFNIMGVTDNTGLLVAYIQNSVVAFNTIYVDPAAGLTTIPALIYTQIGENVSIHHNVAPSFITSTDAYELETIGRHHTLFEQSHGNICLQPAGIGSTIASDQMSFESQFMGPSFDNLTASQLRAALTPKPGSKLLAGAVNVGAVGSYFDWDTNAELTVPNWSKPTSSVAVGAETARSVFDGSEWLRSEPVPTMTNGDELTVIVGIQIDELDNNNLKAICITSESSIYIRKLTSTGSQKNRFEFYLKNADNSGYSFVCQSSLDMRSDRGFQVIGISLRHSTMDLRILSGGVLDPLARVSKWTGLPHRLGGARLDVAPLASTFEFFWMTDAFVEFNDPVILSRITALDGRRPSGGYGADGSLITGAQPRCFIDHTATQINAGNVQKGSASQTFSMVGGTVVAHVPDVTAPTISNLVDTNVGQTQFNGGFDISEANVDVWLVTQLDSIAAPSQAQVMAGQDGTGTALPPAQRSYFDNIDTGSFTFSGTGLDPAETYRTYAVGRDLFGNLTSVQQTSGFTTDSATYAPVFAHFPDTRNASLRRLGEMTGAGPVTQATGVFTYRMSDDDDGVLTKLAAVQSSTNYFWNITKFASNQIGWQVEHNGNGVAFYKYSASSSILPNRIYMVLWSWDATTGGKMAIVDGSDGSSLALTPHTNAAPNDLTSASMTDWFINAAAWNNAQAGASEMERFQLWDNTYVDVETPAGRAHFIAGDGSLVDPADAVTNMLGVNASANRLIDIRGADFVTGNNRGSGGNFSVNGAGVITTG